ncbi:MAG: Coenzyme F420 hydrogenase/dehydrogenase, beta subunit C-terminal domain [Clostridiales bacterium]|nr:Coenzyme F420 hydrogenase/dehydrogenase, beta subunit C-terminal domain [Clostridiales bacterium]
MIKVTDKNKCSGCYACYSVCPKECISMKEDDEGYLYPNVNKNKCINCGICEKKCPIANNNKNNELIETYGCYSKNNDIRKQSSSGGIFSLLAQQVLNSGGVVFGSRYDKDFNVIHDYIEDVNELYKLRGSKYLQSIIGENFKIAKEFLEQGILVLFSGTPCQIDGLIKFLGKEYKNLITVDIICHGVPSKKVWNSYREYMNIKGDISSVNFRDKSIGWEEYSIKIEYKNKPTFSQLAKDNLYMIGFVNDFYLRPSCYDCKSKGINRASDITLGDFWGINNILPELNDKKGTSIVLIQSQKGENLFNQIKPNIIFKETEINDVIKYNKSIVESAVKSEKRERFFKYINNFKFNQAIDLSMEDSKIGTIKKYIKFKILNISK